jgi:hypothetical protein
VRVSAKVSTTSKRAAPSKTGIVRLQFSGDIRSPRASAGMMTALTGSTTPRLCASFTGTRSGFSSTGGVMSTAATLPPASPMRTVRWSEPERDVTAKEEGIGRPPPSAPAAFAAPLPPVSAPASPVSRAWIWRE